MEQNDGKFDEQLQRLNREGVDTLLEAAERIRGTIMGLVVKAVRSAVQQDQINRSQLNHPSQFGSRGVEQYVLVDYLAAPFENELATPCVSIRLDRNKDLGQQGDDSLYLYVPEPENFVVTISEPEELPDPEVVFLKRIDSNGVILESYKITADGARKYIGPADYPDRDQEIEGDTYDETMAGTLTKRVDSRLPVLTEIAEDIVNMKLVPQGSYIRQQLPEDS